MSLQSIYKLVAKAVFAPVAAALSTTNFVITPSRRRLFMPRV
jgi:hypothetical protein